MNHNILLEGGSVAKCWFKHPWTSNSSLQVVLLARSLHPKEQMATLDKNLKDINQLKKLVD